MDETNVTPEEEVKVEGTVEAEIAKSEPVVEPKVEAKKPEPETVPLAVYLDLKEDLKALKHEIKESKGSAKERVEIQGISELTTKYPDVNPEFIQDMFATATKEATKKIEEKYTPIIERQENEKKQLAFDKAFDNLFEKTLQDNPDLPKSIDKELIKELASTPRYRNIPLSDILVKMYANGNNGKSSSENDARTAGDRVEDVVSFDKINSDQKKAIMDDPKTRQKYFDWLDGQTGFR